MTSATDSTTAPPGYRHAALFYEGIDGFVDGLVPFLREGVDAGEPTLVVVSREKIARLRAALGDAADHIQFADMADVGSNPARIIPAWQEFVAAHPGQSLRGIGEPIFPERAPAELRECQHHERLLNPALAGSDLFLVCPYDTLTLSRDVIEEAWHSHPAVAADGTAAQNDGYAQADEALFEEPLPEPPADAETLPAFGPHDLAVLRDFVAQQAERAQLSDQRRADLVLAVSELVSNSVRYGGGVGNLRIWRDESHLVCEVRDRGRIDDPLIDRRPPPPSGVGARGLWLANQLCELVQLRSLPSGVVARAHVRLN